MNPIGILLVNLGTPTDLTVPAIKKYLDKFLSDKRVVDMSPWLWQPILKGLILNSRPKKSAQKYKKIWTQSGSPLNTFTRSLTEKLEQHLQKEIMPEMHVKYAMTYSEPSISNAMKAFNEESINRIIVLPLYPQYSGSTTGSVYDQLFDCLGKSNNLPHLHIINNYHIEPEYIKAVAKSIATYWDKNGKAGHTLFSYHGIPQRYADNGDPYPAQCRATSYAIANQLNIEFDQWTQIYQSRFGKAPWLKPYCDDTLKEFAAGQHQEVDILCPGFSIDCLESLEEIAITSKQLFLDNGGKKYRFISCLNDTDEHVVALANILSKAIASMT
jgi:protoporphyrin/coproporphyrin ferrochelatase